MPLPLIHAGTAVFVALLGRRLFGARIGGIAGFGFVCLPAVALASLLVSTDTPMLFCFALALLAFDHLRKGRSLGWAVVMGAAIGAGLLSKYAMIYFPLSALIARVAAAGGADRGVMRWLRRGSPWRSSRRTSPGTPANDFATLQHTADNADWQGDRSLRSRQALAEFLAGQFAVAGPVFFAAYLVGARRNMRRQAGVPPGLR